MEIKGLGIYKKEEVGEGASASMLESPALSSVRESSLSHVSDETFPLLDKSAYPWQPKINHNFSYLVIKLSTPNLASPQSRHICSMGISTV